MQLPSLNKEDVRNVSIIYEKILGILMTGKKKYNHEKAVRRNPPINSFTGDRKTLTDIY